VNAIEYAITEHRPVAIYALFSGGDGSLSATHFSMENGAQKVFHVRTGIGVEERKGLDVEEYVRETCNTHGWPLIVKTPPDVSYEEMVLKWGFPGPGAHLYPYSWLKERAIAELVRESKHKWRDRVALCTGVRNSDSARRMGYVTEVIRIKARVWVAPLFSQSVLEVYDYIRDHGLERSPIAKLFGMSGECLCGAFAKPGELAKIKLHFPKLGTKIDDLQIRAKAAGVYCKWGVRPPKKKDPRQTEIPFMPMCVNCHGSNPLF